MPKITKSSLVNLIPNVTCKSNEKEILKKVHSYSQAISLKTKKRNSAYKNHFLIASIILLFTLNLILFAAGSLSSQEETFILFISIVIALILIISLVFPLFRFGKKLLFIMRKFILRYGLKLLMVILDVMYLPLLESFSQSVLPMQVQTNQQYIHTYSSGNWYEIFSLHHYEVLPCFNNDTRMAQLDDKMNIKQKYFDNLLNKLNIVQPMTKVSEFCEIMCNGKRYWRLNADLSLRYFDDAVLPSIGLICFAIFAVIIGIPFLWYWMIVRNKNLISGIHVYGRNLEEKWQSLSRKLDSPGISLSFVFKHSNIHWCIFPLLMKFFLSVITAFGVVYSKFFVYCLPLYYILLMFLILWFRPYSHLTNTILDFCLFFVNFIFSIIPILGNSGIEMNVYAITVFSFLGLLIPILSFICLLVLRKSTSSSDYDWTNYQELPSDEKEWRLTQITSKLFSPEYQDDAQVISIKSKLLIEDKLTSSQKEQLEHMIDDIYFPKDEGRIQYFEISSLAEYISYSEKTSKVLHANLLDSSSSIVQQEDEFITVNKRQIAHKLTQCYKNVDMILDGYTIVFIRKALQIGLNLGFCAFGWFVASMSHSLQNLFLIEC